MAKNKNISGKGSKKEGKGKTQIPPKVAEEKDNDQLLAELRLETVIMKKWYNKYCQIVPDELSKNSEETLPLNGITKLFDVYLGSAGIDLMLFETVDKESLYTFLEEELVNEKSEELVNGTSDERKYKESHKISCLRNQYKIDISKMAKKLDTLAQESASEKDMMFTRLKCRRLILENKKALVYGRHWTDLYREIVGRGLKCDKHEVIHDLVQVMMIDKLVKFSDDFPTRIHWSDSLLRGSNGEDSWEGRHNFPILEISCFGTLPLINDTPKASTFEGLDNDQKKVCDEYMNRWKKWEKSVNEASEDSPSAYKFKRSLLEEEKELLDKEEIKELLKILFANSIRLFGVGKVKYTKEKWYRQLAVSILEMQQGGLLSWMSLPVYCRRDYKSKRMIKAKEALKKKFKGDEKLSALCMDIDAVFGIYDYYDDDTYILYTPTERLNREEENSAIFQAIREKTMPLDGQP